jgi:CRISPR-associated endonuclease Csn1
VNSNSQNSILFGANVQSFLIITINDIKKMAKILAFDPGTNSLGMVCRDTLSNNLMDQITSGVDIIRDNTESDSRGRHSSAASQRRSFRNARTRYRSVKRRKQATLKLLIKHKCCPLDVESLNQWRFDDDEKGYDRTFPVKNEAFMKWINFEFVIEGEIVRSVYRLREILATKPLDYSKPESWLMLGRAIYSIAVRRGFKSSRLAKASDAEDEEQTEIQASEAELSKSLDQYMREHNCPTVGAAFSRMERVEKIRIRGNSDYKPIRSMLKEEIKEIFKVQKLDIEGKDYELYNGLMSEKKHEGTIFYKNPLKSQKGKVEYCTLEPHKRRCAKSHPANEFNVAWQLLNNIKIKKDGQWENIDLAFRRTIFDKLFVRNKKHFDFQEIRELVQEKYHIQLAYKESINYSDKKSVPACPITYYLQKILGPSWKIEKIKGTKKHLTHAQKRKNLSVEVYGHHTEYTADDIWHICYESDEKQFAIDFAKNALHLTPSEARSMGALWENIQDGYANLSLCALKKINPFLDKGYKYSDAVMLANLPNIMGTTFFKQNEQDIVNLIDEERAIISDTNRIYDIANKLISEYKALRMEDLAFAEHDYEYTLREDDIADVKKACAENYGKAWDVMTDDIQSAVITRVAKLYQEFFFSSKRDYYKRINITGALKKALAEKYPFLTKNKLAKLYHHSNNAYYPSATTNENGILQLGRPARGNLKNPTVLKVLYKIKQNVNKLLINGDIDSDTIIIVENAREALNDFNMRWAIEEYNSKRERENKAIEDALNDLAKEYHLALPKESVAMARLALYQNVNFTPYNPNESRRLYDKLCEKYKLWLKQGFFDFYTGRPISLSELFSPDNLVEVDHILPISKSFDDSISNKVLSSSRYNSDIKGTKLPCELPNYSVDTAEGTAIIHRIHEIEEKVKYLEEKVMYWKGRSSRAADPDSKNSAIKQRHLWQMEYDEWNQRLTNLTAKEITPSFRNNQLNDTRMISKYAYHYLKSVFGRVVVQRGQTTAVFRKIFGFQEAYEKKDRSRHTHHAIDALTLSLIPYGTKRERMMELWYQIQEAHRFKDYDLEHQLKDRLEREKLLCGLGRYSPDEVIRYIEETTLVKNDATNNALTKNIKRYRVRGKVVPLRDKNGNIVYEKTAKGKIRVKAKHVSQGNSIRGAIHDQSFYGKIEKWKDDGSHDKEELFVIRRKLEFKAGNVGSGFKSWDDLEKQMVDKKLFKKFKAQYPEGTPFKDACAEGFYTYIAENGVRHKVKVRHVRCLAITAQPLKKHIFQPQHSDKVQYYYVSPGEAYGVFEYVSKDGKRLYESDNLFTLSTKMKSGVLTETPCPKYIIDKKGKEYVHTRTILKDATILIYPSSEHAEGQYDLDASTISKRLYRINTIEMQKKRLTLTRHNLVKSCTVSNPINDSNFSDLPEGIRMSITKLNFLLLGTDFDIIDGKIVPTKND